MTETVDQAQARPPRALAGVIEDATSLSLVSTSHFEGSRGGRLTSRRHRIPAKQSHRDRLPHTPLPWMGTPGTLGWMTLAVLRPSSWR